MARRLPPLPALGAFEAAARLSSFTAAAAELCITQSAVSHRIRTLETFLGRRLFERRPDGVRLTDDGRRYMGEVAGALDRIEHSTAKLTGSAASGVLRVRSTPGFANRWLAPRLAGFAAHAPQVTLQISTGMPPADFRSAECDVLIHWGEEPLPGAEVIPFFASTRFAVASPHLFDGAPPEHPHEFAGLTLLHDVHGDGWVEYAAAAGPLPYDVARGPRFQHCDLILAAAEAGQGVAIAYAMVVETMLRDRRLIRLGQLEIGPYLIHSLAVAANVRPLPAARAFMDWIMSEAGRQERTRLLTRHAHQAS